MAAAERHGLAAISRILLQNLSNEPWYQKRLEHYHTSPAQVPKPHESPIADPPRRQSGSLGESTNTGAASVPMMVPDVLPTTSSIGSLYITTHLPFRPF